jgi:DNA modification methylase
MIELPRNTLLVGDALDRLRTLPTDSVDCVVSSPPFYALRDYGVDGQIGLEPHVDLWVEKLVAVFHEAARVLKPTGSAWIDLGDSYSRHAKFGAPPKGMLGSVERLTLALMADGWIIRNKVIWARTNPMPHSVSDRLNTTYDTILFAVRQRSYFYNLAAIREPHTSAGGRRATPPPAAPAAWAGPLAGKQDGLHRPRPPGVAGHLLGKNPGDLWRLSASSYRGAHFATFPEALVERPLLATCPEQICTRCLTTWKRDITVRRLGVVGAAGRDARVRRYPTRWQTVREVGPLMPCGCNAPTTRGVVLDPFFGTGTVGVVAERLNRDWVGIELNGTYAAMAERRLATARARAA